MTEQAQTTTNTDSLDIKTGSNPSSPTSSSSPPTPKVSIPPPGTFLSETLPRLIERRRQRSRPRTRSPLRNAVCFDEAEDVGVNMETVLKDNKHDSNDSGPQVEVDSTTVQLEDPHKDLAAQVRIPPAPSVSEFKSERSMDATQDDIDDTISDAVSAIYIGPIDSLGNGEDATMTKASAGGAVEGVDPSGSALPKPTHPTVVVVSESSSAPTSTSPSCSSSPSSTSSSPIPIGNFSEYGSILRSSSATGSDSSSVSGSWELVEDLSAPATDPVSVVQPTPVGLGLMEVAAHAEAGSSTSGAGTTTTTTGQAPKRSPTNTAACPPGRGRAQQRGGKRGGRGRQQQPKMQPMTLESSSSIERISAPMVPPSLASSGGSASSFGSIGSSTWSMSMAPPSLMGSRSGASSGRGFSGRGRGSSGRGSASARPPAVRRSDTSGSSSSLTEPPVQVMCAPTAVMPGPSPLTSTSSSNSSSSPTSSVDDTANVEGPGISEILGGEEAGYDGSRLLKTPAVIESWRHACADAIVEMDYPVVGAEEVDQPAVERRDDAHNGHCDKPVGRREGSDLHSDGDATPTNTTPTNTNISTTATIDNSNLVESTSNSSTIKPRKSVEGLGLGFPSAIMAVVATRSASVNIPGPSLSDDDMFMSTAPGCSDLAALAHGDVDVTPTSEGSSAMAFVSEMRNGTRFFTPVPVYSRRGLWAVDEEDEEDLALFNFDDEEELRRLDEFVSDMEGQYGQDPVIGLPLMLLPRVGLGAGVALSTRLITGAWSRITGQTLYGPAAEVVDNVHGVDTLAVDSDPASEASSSSRTSLTSGSLLEEESLVTTAATSNDFDDVPLSSTSNAGPTPPAMKTGHLCSWISRFSLSRSSSKASHSNPAATPSAPTSSGFVEHTEGSRGFGFGRLGTATVKRFQKLF